MPASRGIAEAVIAADLFRLSLGPGHGSVLSQRRDLSMQSLVAGEPEDVADMMALAPGHGFMPGIVTVAADDDLNPGPAAADRSDQMTNDEENLGAVRRLTRAQDHSHRLATAGVVDVDRQKRAVIVMGVEQGELLMAMNAIQGVVDIEDDPPRDNREAVAVELDHGVHHARKRDPVGQVLETAHGRLRAEVSAAFGQPADRHLESRIGT